MTPTTSGGTSRPTGAADDAARIRHLDAALYHLARARQDTAAWDDHLTHAMVRLVGVRHRLTASDPKG